MSTSIPSTMQAIKINGNKARLVSDVPLPKLRPTYVLIQVNSIALNPTDWKQIANKLAAPNGTSGCDFAGTVVEIGPEVTKSLKPGDRVAGVTHGANHNQPEDGCFAEYAIAKGDLLVKLPPNLSFEEAATFPLGVSTVGQGLFQKALKLNLPTDPVKTKQPVLIYAGSTATGALAIQFAKLSGYRVLTTCGRHNFDTVKALGADEVFDYSDPSCGSKINKATNNSLELIWDTISTESSAKICAEAFSSNGSGARYGSISGLVPRKSPKDGVESITTIMYTIFNESFSKGGQHFPASEEDFEFAKKFFTITEKLLAEGKLKTHSEKIGSNGLAGALKGMRELKDGKVSGQKLVYRVKDTPKDSNVEIEF